MSRETFALTLLAGWLSGCGGDGCGCRSPGLPGSSLGLLVLLGWRRRARGARLARR